MSHMRTFIDSELKRLLFQIMINDKTLVTMDGRNVVFSVVQDRSKIQTLTPTLFKMSTQQQQTAEKSVQTQDSSGSTTLLVTNNPGTHVHTENTAAEVANTLVSMATGRQRTNTVKQLSVISLPNQTTLPIIALADYTTARGVPTAMTLANQTKLTPSKDNELLDGSEMDTDEVSMSTDDYNQSQNDIKSPSKSRRGKSNKSAKLDKQQGVEAIQYGPILVKPRKSVAPTLANGRKSKDQPLPPEEELKRKQRRDRNKQAAAKCRRKRNNLREDLEQIEKELMEQQQDLEHTVQTLNDQRNQLEAILLRHPCAKKTRLPITTTTANTINLSKPELKVFPTATLLDSNNNGNNKRVTINFTNAQDLLAVAPLTRITPTLTTTDGSSSTVPMITIHIIPEVAQALLGSSTVDKNKLVELLQQANVNANNSSATSDSTTINTSSNSTG
ncbi:unnamed protein product [Adineta ricciae]|uniref:BZIP domain-containing protein n=1 Tax=Adineta ricciae TaxID=249248 RepID=A0A814TID6_ADIRI|nr:unnamed protein product [Adineta ricciae]